MVESAKGTYQRISEENCEEILKELNIGYMLRKAANISNPQMEITEENGEWTIKTSTILKTLELKFRIGEEFDDITPDGRKVSCLVTVEGNKIICVQTAKNKKDASTKSVREFVDDECVVTTEILGTNVVSVQKFKKI